MKISLLGPLEVSNDAGSMITPTALRQRLLLTRLCVDAGRLVSTDQLLSALWPDEQPRDSCTALHVNISRLRKYLANTGADPGTVVTAPGGYAINLERHQLDVHDFRDLVAQARKSDRERRMESAIRQLRQALSLWRGDPFRDLRKSVTLACAATAFEEERNAVHERLIQLELSLGRHHQIIGELHELTVRHPTWETVHAQLMIALYRGGRTAESLTVYEAIRRRLVADFGIEPSGALKRIHLAVLRQDNQLEHPGFACCGNI
ncbi:activator protein [Micromonospora sp. KC207]|uniref:AfsR/SARP family transcriptional regulator n=1 Tax=Micromonospora sp. KC207 TaxID=2530377 RepID=UPI001044420C|nr:AfsR/SARP family transcriptional regulator [Micromonospora sp. KC207]TDC61064.1 activator protein [Micromonospora sp. KC207]